MKFLDNNYVMPKLTSFLHRVVIDNTYWLSWSDEEAVLPLSIPGLYSKETYLLPFETGDSWCWIYYVTQNSIRICLSASANYSSIQPKCYHKRGKIENKNRKEKREKQEGTHKSIKLERPYRKQSWTCKLQNKLLHLINHRLNLFLPD